MDIYNQCLDIINDKNQLNYQDLNTKWKTFKEKYPQLYNMLTIESTIDLNMLKFMCEMCEKNMKSTKEEQLENEFMVGDVLAKKYLYNKFNEPTSEHKELIKKSLREKLNK